MGTLYLCSACNGVHDNTDPPCTSIVVHCHGIGTHHPDLVSLVADRDRLQAEVERLTKERDEWKRRAASHGCDVEKGDPDCG